MAGFAIDGESDPIEVFRNFRAGIYDLLMLDIRMPDVDGIELYGKVREIYREFKVCFISTFVAGEYEKLRHQYPNWPTAAALSKSP